MKLRNILFILLICISLTVFSGSGYKGTLPDLNLKMKSVETNTLKEQQLENKMQKENDILPLDKLTIPVRATVKIDKRLISYKTDFADILRQLERIKEVLDTDKSFKNYIAAANVLNLTTQNFIREYPDERFVKTNMTLSNINYDVQQIKNYWVVINKNAPYVSNYETNGTYSKETLNNELNKFSKVLDYAIKDIRSNLDAMKESSVESVR